MNLLYIDTEYSGFYSADRKKTGELLQLAIVPVISGVVQETFNEYCRPLGGIWSVHAERVHKIPINWAKSQQHPNDLAKKLFSYVNKFDCIFTCAGWNCRGDKSYIERLIIDAGNAIPWYRRVRMEWRDVITRAKDRKQSFPMVNYKLETAAKFFRLKFNSHNALDDADITRQIDDHLSTVEIRDSSFKAEAHGLSNVDKRYKYTTSKYMNVAYGSVLISEDATRNPEAMRFLLEELWEVFVEGR